MVMAIIGCADRPASPSPDRCPVVSEGTILLTRPMPATVVIATGVGMALRVDSTVLHRGQIIRLLQCR